jgi:hypothetical protein
MGLGYIHEENGDRLLIESFARPATWAKRPVQTGHPCELREPVRGAKGSLAIQTGAERGEFVVKQRVHDPMQPISGERNRKGVDQGGMPHIDLRVDQTIERSDHPI